jgi:uncharacterized protein (TIGR02996 family)
MIEGYYQDLARSPEDWALRSVFADWCDDNGKPEVAEALRWMVKNHKRPHSSSTESFTWFNADTIGKGLGDPESDIPGAYYKLLQGGQESANHKSYPSLRAAEEAFHAAWTAAAPKGTMNAATRSTAKSKAKPASKTSGKSASKGKTAKMSDSKTKPKAASKAPTKAKGKGASKGAAKAKGQTKADSKSKGKKG